MTTTYHALIHVPGTRDTNHLPRIYLADHGADSEEEARSYATQRLMHNGDTLMGILSKEEGVNSHSLFGNFFVLDN